MAKIVLNNEEFGFQGYNRNTYFNGENITSTGYITGLSGSDLPARLEALAESALTSIIIKKEDNTVIYSLTNLNAKINSIDENYNGIDAVLTSLNLQFNQ